MPRGLDIPNNFYAFVFLNYTNLQISTTQAMVQVYIRGRGRGRYVCERCGIRCKKPSMLKKHLR